MSHTKYYIHPFIGEKIEFPHKLSVMSISDGGVPFVSLMFSIESNGEVAVL